MLVGRLPALLNEMLGRSARKPRTIFTDRGPGFYHRRWEAITGDYESACREHGFKSSQGSNSKKGPHAQPGDIGDVLLHETAISWMRRREEATRPTKPWEETPHDVAARLQAAVCHVNEQFEARALCKEFPKRLHDLVNTTRGDRLPKWFYCTALSMFAVVRRLCRACLNVGCFGSAINKKCLRVETGVACGNHHLRRCIIKTCRCVLIKLSPDKMYCFRIGVPDCRPPGCHPAVVPAAAARPPLARLPPARVPARRPLAARPDSVRLPP